MQIGRAIYRIRKSKGITLKELSAEIGISRFSLSRIETGNRRLTWDVLVKISEGLRVKVSDIVVTYERLNQL